MTVISAYKAALSAKGYTADAAQQAAIERLQQFYDDLIRFKEENKPQGMLKRLFNHKKPEVPKGVYMWGGVGRGKSFLMDSFYDNLPYRRKIRIHFHEFMRSIHDELRELSGTEDPLDEVAKHTARKYRVICFDEFHVSDIADAMILYRLLLKLFEYGCTFVMTSNYEPSTLYPDGLHRDRLLPAIKLIQEKMDVINVDTGVDYRQRTLDQAKLYYSPLTPANEEAFEHLYHQMTDHRASQADHITIDTRKIPVVAVNNAVIWFTFKELCEGNHSQNDYLDIAARYDTVFLSDVPKMDAKMASAARRFTWLVDVFYDFKVKLIMSAAVEPEALYTEGVLANEFFRTVSRIVEMQSKEFLHSQRREKVHL